MPSTKVFNELCVKISLLRSIPKKKQCGLLPVMHRSYAHSFTSCIRGIRWLPSPEDCRMGSFVTVVNLDMVIWLTGSYREIYRSSTAETLLVKLPVRCVPKFLTVVACYPNHYRHCRDRTC